MDTHATLKLELRDRLLELAREYKKVCGHAAIFFLNMLAQWEPDEIVRQLVLSQMPASGFMKLYERRRLDATVEYIAAYESKWRPILETEVTQAARRRLEKFGFNGPSGGWKALRRGAKPSE